MFRIVLSVFTILFALSCSSSGSDSGAVGEANVTSQKADDGDMTDVAWANQFFISQIYDAQWNPSGVETDMGSNSCGPASLAMVMIERGVMPEGVTAQKAIDHARAMMYPSYPEIDAKGLPDSATLYMEDGLAFVEDHSRPVYFDMSEEAPSVPQGITHGGGTVEFGYSWSELDDFMDSDGAVIAYGHITEGWRNRFSGEYGVSDAGAIPHFIALFAASSSNKYIVCDPMHIGGAMIMSRTQLGTFFKSPVNMYDTTIRLIAWKDISEAEALPTDANNPPGT
jgi:hypothetical protein